MKTDPDNPIPAGLVLTVVFFLLSTAPIARGEIDALLSAVPSDALFVHLVRGPDLFQGESTAGSSEGANRQLARTLLAGLAVDSAQRWGLLSNTSDSLRHWLDGIASAATALQFPHAVVVLDAAARARSDGGHELAGLHAAIILRTNGNNMPLVDRINHLLRSYTNREDTKLTEESDSARSRYRITDRRLPDWFCLEWGAVGDWYVVSVGKGAFLRIRSTIEGSGVSLATDQRCRNAWDRIGASRADLAWYLHVARLADPADAELAGKIRDVFAAFGMGDVRKAVAAVRVCDQVVEIDACLVRPDGEERIRLAGARPPGENSRKEVPRHDTILSRRPRLAPCGRFDPNCLRKAGRFRPAGEEADRPSFIPDGALGYSIVQIAPGRLMHALRSAWLASRSEDGRESSLEFWRTVERRSGVSLDADIFARLGRYFVIHDYPPHPLHVPLLWTIAVPIERESEALREKLDRLFTYASGELARDDGWRLHRHDDGIWSLHLGIEGPAVYVGQEWVLISFSPVAVRMNLDFPQ